MTNTENTKGQNSCTAMMVAGIALFSSSVALSGDRSTPVTSALDLHLSRVVDNVIYNSGIIDCVLTDGIATQCYTLVAQRDGLSHAVKQFAPYITSATSYGPWTTSSVFLAADSKFTHDMIKPDEAHKHKSWFMQRNDTSIEIREKLASCLTTAGAPFDPTHYSECLEYSLRDVHPQNTHQ